MGSGNRGLGGVLVDGQACAFDLVEEHVEVGVGGPGVDVDHAEGGVAVDGGVVDHDVAGVFDDFADFTGCFAQGAAAFGAVWEVSQAFGDVVKQYVEAVRLADKFKVLAVADLLGEVLAVLEELVDAGFESVGAVDLPG